MRKPYANVWRRNQVRNSLYVTEWCSHGLNISHLKGQKIESLVRCSPWWWAVFCCFPNVQHTDQSCAYVVLSLYKYQDPSSRYIRGPYICRHAPTVSIILQACKDVPGLDWNGHLRLPCHLLNVTMVQGVQKRRCSKLIHGSSGTLKFLSLYDTVC